MSDGPANRTPNYCPFCAVHWVNGGTGDRHGSFVCRNCHAEYSVQYFHAYPPGRYEQGICDDEYVKHRDRYDGPISD